ncbi:hypothetical protein HN419_00225 [Candidatus Woesearchaeota archaeon]|jgi:RIO-like serine/threonine protein kinase|nr:hypothetical protein [Candidatus Woesearchaeota archaeon]MBT3538427.1 hypothetical protein [Candidatus Woesearchaeota archaeon]MBT4696877.1 hypothetical protein [Candidatus Woesearchaeota archaeon]MBT7106117.1 hypothetical protein [Candidatus Woesearchaeota archaeon]MBT7930985.1 hypothetical protein [Candidatus Woesearchaeota archaeon]
MSLKKKIVGIYKKFLAFLIVCVSRRVECMILKFKYSECSIFNKGSGSLNKYLIKIDNRMYFLKKSNFLIEHRQNVINSLKPDQTIPLNRRFMHIEHVIQNNLLGEFNLCIKATKDYVMYKYIEGTESLDISNFNKEAIVKLIETIRELHKKGYHCRDFACRNIIVKNNKYYLIDIGGIQPLQDIKDGEKDFEKLILSAKDKDLKAKISQLVRRLK